ncbi:MAG: hypothetical protein JWP91_736 [Fibrobacteres bacterium]|nr:hypothetical protein [Fibrobacterota bacterium]
MSIRTICVTAALAWGISSAANLQPQDLLFVSTHKYPTQVVGDSKNAFLLTEGGILMYDYRKSAWLDNLVPGGPVSGIRFSQTRSKLYVLMAGGRTLEYNPVFRRFTDASLEDYQAATDAGTQPDLTGLTLDGDNFFLGDALRDKYMRRAPIKSAKVFDYDNLWILTDGLGPFYGSVRRKQASSFWFGLDYPATSVIYPEGNNLWFGSCRSDFPGANVGTGIASQSNGALVKAKADLNGWKAYPAQLEYGFGDGCVRDIKAWRDFIWLATDKGLVRHDPRTGLFKTVRHMMGSTDVRVNFLHVHENLLYLGTERGVCFLDDVNKDDLPTLGELPVPGGVQVFDLVSKDKDLWAATRYGLHVFQGGAWKSLNKVSAKDVPEATNVLNLSMAYHDTSMYWIYENKVMVKPRRHEQKVLLERDHPTKLAFDGEILYVAFRSGVTAYDTRKGLWTDFRLEDGIPGSRVVSMALSAGKLWIGTDAGVQRVNLRSYLP